MAADDRPLGERLAVLEERVREMQDDMREVRVAISGPPREDSIRGRLHKLEDDSAAANAAKAALEAAQALREQQGVMQLTVVEKRVGMVLGVVVAFCALAGLILNVYQG